MVVKTRIDGHAVTGLFVGSRNVSRYFPEAVNGIELQLEDLRIECALEPEFWKSQPVIHDPRLCEWLYFKSCRGRRTKAPVPFVMTPLGPNSFKLHPASPVETDPEQMANQ